MSVEELPRGAALRRRRWLFAIIAAVAVAGVVVVVLALLPVGAPPAAPPQPAAAPTAVLATSAAAASTPSSAARPGAAASGAPTLPRSVPTRLDVPAIGVHSSLLQLGVNPDRTIQVPPLEQDSKAGWFDQSPAPGQLGPAVLLGHVDSARYGPGVFFRLGAMAPGQSIEVTRSDATIAEFAVDHVDSYPKNAFPSLQVYGNTADPQLRLITCGGVFDPAARSYENNIVVYAHLVGTRPT